MWYEVVGENMTRAEWLRARRDGIGGSDAPAILGLSKYDSPLSVYASKVAEGDFEKETEPRYRRLGRELEPVMLQLAMEETGAQFFNHTPNTLFRSKLNPIAMCTMDGQLAWDDGRTLWCEVKTGADADDWNNGVPESVEVQTQHQLFVTGADELVVSLFFTGWAADYAVTRIKRNEELIGDVLLPAIDAFWNDHVLPRREQGLPIDGNDYTRQALQLLHPHEEGEARDVILPGDDWLDKADELRELGAQRRDIEKAEKKIKNEFLQQLAGKKQLILSDGTYFTNSSVPASTIERKAHTRFLGPYGGAK